MNKKIFIVGTGGFAKEVLFLIDTLQKYNQFYGFLEPDEIWENKWKDKELMGNKVLPFSDFNPSKGDVTIGVGASDIRELTTKQLPSGTEYISLVHPQAQISRWVSIGDGAIITAGCIVTTDIEIGNHCHLNLNTTIGHDTQIGNFFTSAPAVNISGNCDFDNHIYFGTGAATKQGVNICSNVTIGMGAMVTKDIIESGTYIGIPAKRI